VLFVALITFWDNGYQKWLAKMEPDAPAQDEDEWDYDEDGELVKVARPEPRFPVPPMDLPHYHGLDLGDTVLVDTGLVDTGLAETDGATKEVTGA
jgi:hypothetical protein